MIRNLRSLGKTVVLTTHYMDEAENLADRVAIMVDGRIVAEGTPAELVRKDRATTVRFKVTPEAGTPPAGLSAQPTDHAGGYTITTDTPTHTLHRLTGWAVEHGIELAELAVSQPTLEDLFVELADRGGADRGDA